MRSIKGYLLQLLMDATPLAEHRIDATPLADDATPLAEHLMDATPLDHISTE